MESRIETSARHIHLTEEDFRFLFGNITPHQIKRLSQNDVSCEEMVTISGEKSVIDNVRVLIPFRKESQLEISRTDAINLGIDAPLKLSGDLPGAMVKVSGPNGSFEKAVAIVAKRHIHLNLEDSEKFGIADGDTVSVKTAGERPVIFKDVVARVKDVFTLSVHLDTDESNAAGLPVASCEVIKEG